MNSNLRVEKAGAGGIWTFLLVFSAVILFIGVYLGFIKSHGYVKATGVVVSLREEERIDADEGHDTVIDYYPTVKFNVDGKEYTGELDISTGPGAVGEEVKIQYDPLDPSKVNSYSPGIVTYIFVVGIVLLAVSVFKIVSGSRGK